MSKSRQAIITKLKALEREWPKDGTMLMANGNFLYLCTKHPQDGGKVLESFHIPNDGGDPEWNGDTGDKGAAQKRLPKFKPPSTKYLDMDIEPPPSFTGDKS